MVQADGDPDRARCGAALAHPYCRARLASAAETSAAVTSIAMTRRLVRLVAVLVAATVVLLSLSGCAEREELLSDLDTHQSIDVVVALERSGIHAQRERVAKGREERYVVYVSQGDYARALQVLHEYRLPGDPATSIDQVTAPQGFVPNARELTNVRLDHAIALSVERLLSALPGVVEVRAVVRSYHSSAADDRRLTVSAPTASVVIRYLSPSGVLPFSLDDAKEMVRKAVPGLSPDSLSVTTTRVILSGELIPEGVPDPNATGVPLSSLLPFLFRVAPGEQQRALRQILGVVLISTVSGGVLGLWLGLRSRRRRARSNRGAKSRSFFLEATYRGDEDRSNAPAVQSGGAKPGAPDRSPVGPGGSVPGNGGRDVPGRS